MREFLAACARTDQAVVIVGNNASAAIELFLERHGLAALVVGVLGRPNLRATKPVSARLVRTPSFRR
ncbi:MULTISPECIES: hypothetical protein [unclassified Kribbella]|uniref:hypothetical protein n=1 Tax=unclassified Kribbella TaxID=2644121 RepID=UPI003015BD3F